MMLAVFQCRHQPCPWKGHLFRTEARHAVPWFAFGGLSGDSAGGLGGCAAGRPVHPGVHQIAIQVKGTRLAVQDFTVLGVGL